MAQGINLLERTIEEAGAEGGSLKTSETVGVCLGCMSFYPLYAGPALRFQRYAPGLMRRGARMRVFTQSVTEALIERDGSVAGGKGSETPKAGRNGARAAAKAGQSYPDFEVIDGLPVQRVALPGGRRREMVYFQRLARYCRQHRAEIDVIQLLNADFLAAPWLLQMRRMGIGLVFTHTLLADLSPKGWKRSAQRIHRRLPLELMDRVVVSSQAMREKLLELGVSTPVEVIPNGVDLKRFHPAGSAEEKARLRQALGLDPNRDVALAVGPVIPRKGVDALVEAFASLVQDLPQARLLLVGPRHDLARPDLADFQRRLESTLAQAGARERVLFTGAVDNVQDYLRAADVLVFPSRREGMPNVVPEAMASGLPVILTPFTGLPVEFGRDGEEYILSDWEPQRLAADLRRLLADRALQKRLGQEARRWIAANLDIEKSLDAYIELYRRLRRKRK